MIKLKKDFTVIKFYFVIIIILATMSIINSANASSRCEWGLCGYWDSKTTSPISCLQAQANVFGGIYRNYYYDGGCFSLCFSGSCTCGSDGAAYCTGDYERVSGIVLRGSPPAAATCSTGPDGTTYCLASGSTLYSPSGVNACYNQTNCLASTPPAAATCSTGPDGKTYCLASGSATYSTSGVSACYNKTNCFTSTPPAAATCSTGPDGKTYCLASGSALYSPSDVIACYNQTNCLASTPPAEAICSAGPDGKTYCLASGSATYSTSGVSACYNKTNCLASTPPAAATCSTGPDGKTYCLASGSATYSTSGVSACYNKTNCFALTPPAAAICQVGYDGKTYCPGSYPSGISSCYDKPNCINNETPPTFDLPNGTKCNGGACVCDSDTCRCNNNAIQNCTTVGTSSTCTTPDSSNSCNLNLNSPSGSNCVGTGCAENNGFFSCTNSNCLISDGSTACTGTSCECKVSGNSILCKKSSSCTGPACSTFAPKRDPKKVRSTPSFPGIPSNIASIMDKKFDDGMPLTGNIASTKGWGNDGVWGSTDGSSIDPSLCNDSTSSENVLGVKYKSSTDPRKGCLVTFKVF